MPNCNASLGLHRSNMNNIKLSEFKLMWNAYRLQIAYYLVYSYWLKIQKFLESIKCIITENVMLTPVAPDPFIGF